MAITQECCEQYWTSPGGNIPQDTNYTATCLPSWKLFKLDEPDTQDTAGEARTNSSVMYSYGAPHMAKQKQDDQLEHTYRSYVRIRDVALKTCQKRGMIGRSGERGSGISVLAARHDDDELVSWKALTMAIAIIPIILLWRPRLDSQSKAHICTLLWLYQVYIWKYSDCTESLIESKSSHLAMFQIDSPSDSRTGICCNLTNFSLTRQYFSTLEKEKGFQIQWFSVSQLILLLLCSQVSVISLPFWILIL